MLKKIYINRGITLTDKSEKIIVRYNEEPRIFEYECNIVDFSEIFATKIADDEKAIKHRIEQDGESETALFSLEFPTEKEIIHNLDSDPIFLMPFSKKELDFFWQFYVSSLKDARSEA